MGTSGNRPTPVLVLSTFTCTQYVDFIRTYLRRMPEDTSSFPRSWLPAVLFVDLEPSLSGLEARALALRPMRKDKSSHCVGTPRAVHIHTYAHVLKLDAKLHTALSLVLLLAPVCS